MKKLKFMRNMKIFKTYKKLNILLVILGNVIYYWGNFPNYSIN